MSKRSLLLLGCVAIVAAGVVGLVFWSVGWFAVSCFGLGIVIELIVSVGIHGDAPSRTPEENLMQMKANQYGYVAGLELPTDAASWRPMLLGLPALVVGAVVCLLYLFLAAG